jgi:uncharacterized protein YlxW (UPF0749 family)
MSQSNAPRNPPTGAGDRSSWQRLLQMARPRATKANAFLALLAILLGFAATTQVHQNQALGLESLRQSELVTILDNAAGLSARLDKSARELQITRDNLLSGSTGDAAALRVAQERLDTLGVLAGTASAHGPGIEMTIGDPHAKVTPTLLLDAIEELRDAGAEAIQVGSARVVASSSFGPSGSGVEIDGTTLTQPYSILAIGDAQTMSSAMEIPGGLWENVRHFDATITITQVKELTVGALHPLSEPRWARPVPSR